MDKRKYKRRGKGKKFNKSYNKNYDNNHDDDVLSIIKSHKVPFEFPVKVINQARRADKPVSLADMDGRTDFRDVLMITIDSEDAKDLDDAVSVSYDGEYYKLGVYIADVANYVQERSALDREAYKRGTSVYLVDRVLPMLPTPLSNGICSLNEGEDRLSMCCIMTIDGKGDIVEHKICEGVINVNHRMTYHDVSLILSGDEELSSKHSDIVPMLHHMHSLSKILRSKRKIRGGIDFDISERRFTLDENGRIIDIKPYIRDEASMMIEDFMLAANETVAEDLFWKDSAFLYRVHSEPEYDKVRSLKRILSRFGYTLKGDSKKMHPKEFQKMLESVKGKDEETLISKVTLRTMQQARYSADNTGHFGLSARYYCHFTSPIRRYPDLIIHRIIKDHLRGRYNDSKDEHYRSLMSVVASHTSDTERRAIDLEREVEKLKTVQYMHQFLGEEYIGTVSSVVSFGLFVELDNGVDGLIHVSTLSDYYYNFDEDNFELVGERTGRVYTIGQKLNVKLIAVDEKRRTIDFECRTQTNSQQ